MTQRAGGKRGRRCRKPCGSRRRRRAWDAAGAGPTATKQRRQRTSAAAATTTAARPRAAQALGHCVRASAEANANANAAPARRKEKAAASGARLEISASREQTAEAPLAGVAQDGAPPPPPPGPVGAGAELATKIINAAAHKQLERATQRSMWRRSGQSAKSGQPPASASRLPAGAQSSSSSGGKKIRPPTASTRGPARKRAAGAISKTTRTRRSGARCADSLLVEGSPSSSSSPGGPLSRQTNPSRTTRSMSSTSAASSSASSSCPARQFVSDQAQIQTIIDRLRQKTERARMYTSGHLHQGLISLKPGAGRQEAAAAADEMELIKTASRAHQWQWSDVDKSHECVVSKDRLSLCFHPQCSESAAACRGAEPFRRNGNYYYWEIHVQDKTYGTSVMFGLCTKQQRLHANEYCNLVGLDEAGWSVSHKGLAWHQNKSRQFTQQFPTNEPITIGLLYNTMRGELSYFMEGKSLGVAFTGLNDLDADLYPVVGSTAKCTRMRLLGSYCGYVSLLERSCFTLLKSARSRAELVEYLRHYALPKSLLDYLAEAANVCPDDQAGETAPASGASCRDKQASPTNAEDNYQPMNCST